VCLHYQRYRNNQLETIDGVDGGYFSFFTGTINLKQLTAWMVVNHAEQILKLTPDQVALCVCVCACAHTHTHTHKHLLALETLHVTSLSDYHSFFHMVPCILNAHEIKLCLKLDADAFSLALPWYLSLI